MCPYCPNKRFYNSGGWRDHMSKKHPSVPWYGAATAKESVQAQAMLDALSTDPSAHIGSLEEGVSSAASPSPVPSKTSTTTTGERIQALIQEIPTNVQFPQTTQPKLKKQHTDQPSASSSVASTSKAHAQHVGHHELTTSSNVPLPAPPSLPPRWRRSLWICCLMSRLNQMTTLTTLHLFHTPLRPWIGLWPKLTDYLLVILGSGISQSAPWGNLQAVMPKANHRTP